MSTTNNTFSFVLLIIFLLLTTSEALRPYQFSHHGTGAYKVEESKMQQKSERGMELEVYLTGSSLPDCSHACGPCTPCHRVIVSFTKCSVESCPVIYRCMCKGKYYHVPSN
ncbi:protein EPIDERMAL PATTERNING FACTOR 2 [Striga asiatica]|uniref:Epidermal patterning factor-like protein n=1 Tax=Striga asiatica TaxID=4170 RepID=A0A5A7Q9Q7_STRAF|nr:protein EPIDERMAL PATTERNING FACTOR 2 [Striga asiatica]